MQKYIFIIVGHENSYKYEGIQFTYNLYAKQLNKSINEDKQYELL